MVKWCNGEIKIRIGRFVSHKYVRDVFIITIVDLISRSALVQF